MTDSPKPIRSALLSEVWETLSDVCEFHDDPEYHLDVPAIRALMQRIYDAKETSDAMTYKEAVQQKLAEFAQTQTPEQVQLIQMFLADVEFKLLEANKGRIVTPRPTPSGCQNCGCVDQVNLDCPNHIILPLTGNGRGR